MPTHIVTDMTLYDPNNGPGAFISGVQEYFIHSGAGYRPATTADFSSAVIMSGSTILHNGGLLEGALYGVSAQTGGSRILNIGTIIGGSEGVHSSGSLEGAHITNRGTIFGGDAGLGFSGSVQVFIENSGQIIGDSAIYQNPAYTPPSMTVANTGALISTNAYAVSMRGVSFVKMDNSGLVDGHIEMYSNGNVTLFNAGTIRGDVYLVDLPGGTVGRGIYRASGDGQVLGGVFGDAGGDDFSGAAARDYLDGGIGNDTLSGYGGNDSLYGGVGADRLKGGAEDDLLQGGNGADRMSGGLGEDVFYFAAVSDSNNGPFGTDTITDFNRAEDVIDLSALAGTGRYIGTRKFKADGSFQVREVWNKQSKIGTLLVDTNGDRIADMSITLNGQTGLITNDNLLL